MKTFNGKEYPCCTTLTMGVIGGKWKSVIVYHLLQNPMRYSELRSNINGITERTLSLQLKSLEEDGILVRNVLSPKPPMRVEYSLTELGYTLRPVIDAIVKWGDRVSS